MAMQARIILPFSMWVIMVSTAAFAHPMGNFSINHYSGIEVSAREIHIRYILDLAEIPTFQEMLILDSDHNGLIGQGEKDQYLPDKVQALAAGLTLLANQHRLALVPIWQELSVTPGMGRLPTLKLSALYRAQLDRRELADQGSEPVEVLYRDENYPRRAGWKEIAAVGAPGITLTASSVPAHGSELNAYPQNELQSPPQVTEARLAFTTGVASGTGAVPADRPVSTIQKLGVAERFTALIQTGNAQTPMILLALLVAFGLGMLHALSPGHGKTVMAAYLVGSRGTARHALVLGLTVTLSHTIGVFLLGLVTLYFSKFVVPEQLYPWLGFFSGMTIFLIGLVLLRQRWRTGWTVEEADDHHQEHLHRDWSHRHEHAHGHHHHHGDGSLKSLLGLGITGGMVPCPSALVVLLSAIALHQITFGLLLILAFSAGIAATLVTIGLLMVYVEEALTQAERLRPVARLMPALSAGAVAVLGGVIAVTTWL
jgi:ABC-type nickel/cobalt efflux system permease component RcnA